jgi:hypothetical protein
MEAVGGGRGWRERGELRCEGLKTCGDSLIWRSVRAAAGAFK